MERDALDTAIEDAPERPGVYLFRDGERVLYVGKAIDLRDRLTSYRDPRTPWIGEMVQAADSIELREAADARRALLLEANLIKRFQPRYNIRLKDSKSYPVIELTEHRFPQIRASRDPDAQSLVFGPFTAMDTVETAIKAFRDLYGLRACSDHTVEHRDRPCVPYQMGLCSAPCAGLITEDEYADRVETVRRFFREDSGPVLAELEERMDAAAAEHRFERAATLRDYRDALQALVAGRDQRDTGEVHTVAVGPDRDTVGQVIVEDDTITAKQRHRLAGEPATDLAAVQSFLEQFYAQGRLPDRLIVEPEPEEAMVRDWLAGEAATVTGPETGRDRVLVRAAESAAGTATVDDPFRDTVPGGVDRLECFDISHTGGKEVVGSDVVFLDGRPEKRDYRLKRLSADNDDPAAMTELIRWRTRRQLEGRDERPEPDLLLVDGGQHQLAAAREVLEEEGWDVPVWAIVKPDDRILRPETGQGRLSAAARSILRQARDEAHRFAKKTHTASRDSVVSVLEGIDGVGPARRKRLLEQFSFEQLRAADATDLTTVQGIGEETAAAIVAALRVDTED